MNEVNSSSRRGFPIDDSVSARLLTLLKKAVTERSFFLTSPSWLRMAEERASDYEEKLESRVAHASLDVAAKTTVPATEGVGED